jgi:5-(carboxyamino)imidazole ribonucleotide mutase
VYSAVPKKIEACRLKPALRSLFELASKRFPHQGSAAKIRMANQMKKKTFASTPLVGILMGSDSDWPTMKAAADACKEFGIAHEVHVISAHRAPQDLARYASNAHKQGLRVMIAGAGGAAHLPGVTAAFTPLPVIGVPIAGKHLKGLDSLMSIVQMPSGVPVATVAIDGARNAGLLAVQILAVSNPALQQKYIEFKARLTEESRAKNKNLVL